MQHLGVLVEEFSFFPHQETEVGALFRELWVCRSRWLEGGLSIPLPTAEGGKAVAEHSSLGE